MVKGKTVSQWLSEICDPNSIHYDADAAEIYYPNNPRLFHGFDNEKCHNPYVAILLVTQAKLRNIHGYTPGRIEAIIDRFHAKYRNQ